MVKTYKVNVTIENKQGISDPEGETILQDLVIRGGTDNVSEIRTARMLKFTITEKNKDTARKNIQKICSDLRIYNPLVSKVTVTIQP